MSFDTSIWVSTNPITIPVDEDADKHLSRLESVDRALYNSVGTLVISLKAAGLWDKIDVLSLAHKTLNDSLLNIKNIGESTFGNATTVTGSSITFDESTGLVFPAATKGYLDFNYSEQDMTFYSDLSAHLFSYQASLGVSSINSMLSLNGTASGTSITSPSNRLTANTQGTNLVDTGTNIGGFIGWSVRSIIDRVARFNDTEILNVGSIPYGSSATKPNFIGYDAATVDDGVGFPITGWGAGGELTDLELAAYEDIIRTYMQERNLDVY